MQTERRELRHSGTVVTYFETGMTPLTGAASTEERLADRILVPLRQSGGVSEPSKQLTWALARALEDILTAEAIRTHRDWVAAWFEGTPDLAAEKGRLLLALDTLFAEQLIEDGVIHSAERLLETWLAHFPADGAGVVASILADRSYLYRVELLRCVGRLPYRTVCVRAADILRTALQSEDAGIRDAAVRAFELWDEPSLASILREHREPDAWLRDYIDRVLAA